MSNNKEQEVNSKTNINWYPVIWQKQGEDK